MPTISFLDIIGDAHACCTAEGDNRVLMQKVAKELLHLVSVGEGTTLTQIPEGNPIADVGGRRLQEADLNSLEALRSLLARRLAVLVGELQAAVADGFSFEVWMMQQSDTVQATAASWIELVGFDQTVAAAERATARGNDDAANTLRRVARLYAVDCVAQSLGWYLSKRLLPVQQGDAVLRQVHALCGPGPAGLADQALELVAAFGIPDHLLPPIAKGLDPLAWETFNAKSNDNRGEVASQPLRASL